MIRPIKEYNIDYSIDIESANSELLALKYALYYDIEFFNSSNNGIILRDITNNTMGVRLGEYLDTYNNKVIRYYKSSINPLRHDNYDKVYDGFFNQLNNIFLAKKEDYISYTLLI